MNWDRKIAWRGLMALLLALGILWIALSRVPGEKALARTDRPPAPQAGFAAPDFTLETKGGETISLSDLRGQVVLVNFWATWCPPCRAEMPAIQHVFERYQQGLTFPILLDRDTSVSNRYQVRAMPSTFFIDRSGVIHEVTLGGPMSEAFIESQVTDLLVAGGSQ
jgi:peroxiredoxin